jgi:hypothetical protein
MNNNKAVPLIARVGYNRGIKVQYNSPSNDNTNLNQQQQENKQNINIHINTSAEVSDADKYPEPCIIMRAVGGEPDLLASNTTTEEVKPVQSLPNFNKNPLLNIIKPKRINENIEFKIDTDFLRHVIKVLISNHNIAIDNKDINDILAHFGAVEIITDKEIIRTRDVKTKGLCCCDIDQEEVITFIKKIVVCGYNIVKYLPEMVEFINELGINL